ncbi:Uncharacterized protein FVE85_6289 [Porphyridium purpureum]|uniref:Histidine phosphatase family protein n=1 Tax=Porphyridium purpureum TaxID=35688 RepID=A0A5J4Z6Q2_PORPP|nr:Uncharacterized protein FVE85_6289 [Porphyridium purpureum]|eukprot:POR2947..scf295_1
MGKHVLVIRHGERIDFVDPDWKRTAKNPHDPPLTELGLQQADETGQFLLTDLKPRAHVRAIYTSPFTRTVQTACQIAAHLDLPVFVEPGLSEWMFEEYFGASPPNFRTAEQLALEFRAVSTEYTPIMERPAFPETPADAWDRCKGVMRTLLARTLTGEPDGAMICVTHGGPTEFLTGSLLKPGGEAVAKWVTFCSIMECVPDDEKEEFWKIVKNAYHEHLTNPEVTESQRYN